MKTDAQKALETVLESIEERIIYHVLNDMITVLLLRNGGVLRFSKKELEATPSGTIKYDGVSNAETLTVSFIPDEVPGGQH